MDVLAVNCHVSFSEFGHVYTNTQLRASVSLLFLSSDEGLGVTVKC